MLAIILIVGIVMAAIPKYELLGRGNGKNIVKLKDGPRAYLDDAELETFKKTGELPKAPGVEMLEPGTSPQAAEMAALKDRVKALEDWKASIEARIAEAEAGAAAEDQGEPEDPKADRVKALERMKKDELIAIAQGHGLTIPASATNASVAEAIIGHEFPES